LDPDHPPPWADRIREVRQAMSISAQFATDQDQYFLYQRRERQRRESEGLLEYVAEAQQEAREERAAKEDALAAREQERAAKEDALTALQRAMDQLESIKAQLQKQGINLDSLP